MIPKLPWAKFSYRDLSQPVEASLSQSEEVFYLSHIATRIDIVSTSAIGNNRTGDCHSGMHISRINGNLYLGERFIKAGTDPEVLERSVRCIKVWGFVSLILSWFD